MSDNSSSFLCQAGDFGASPPDNTFPMSVTPGMVNYFRTQIVTPDKFPQIYCLNAIGDDGCPVGICPNPDIAGPLVRLSYYVTAFCTMILVFHDPDHVDKAFYPHISLVYSLLITCSISLFNGLLSRPHTAVAIIFAASPVSIYYLIYSIRATIWGHKHRLDVLLRSGKRSILNRGLIFAAAGIWIAIVVYTSLASGQKKLAQASCNAVNRGTIITVVEVVGTMFVFCALVALLPWIISMCVARKDIWPDGGCAPRPIKVWNTIGERFPLVFFISVGIIPIFLWLLTAEGVLAVSESLQISQITDDSTTPSFGQILAMWTAVGPLIQVLTLSPKLWNWFIHLWWIECWCCCGARSEEDNRDPEQ